MHLVSLAAQEVEVADADLRFTTRRRRDNLDRELVQVRTGRHPSARRTRGIRAAESVDRRASAVCADALRGGLNLARDQLLPAVDVVGRARESRVDHDVYGERGDVGRFDDAPDGKRGAELIAAVVELIAEERCRQRCRRSRRRTGSVASKAAVLSAPSSLAARCRRSGFRPVRITLAPSARARRAVSSPMPALPPITTTVCPSSSGSRRMGEGLVTVLMFNPLPLIPAPAFFRTDGSSPSRLSPRRFAAPRC